jgi:hypothetical protein
MSKSFFDESGLILLGIPGGLIFIVMIVAALFLTAHDTPSARQVLTPTAHHQTVG